MSTAQQSVKDSNQSTALGDIVVMENDDIRSDIIQALRSVGCGARAAGNMNEAICLAESGAGRFFILDIHMGEDRTHEGLDALEEIKGIDENIFVAVYSAHPNWYEKQAMNLGADLFVVKTSDLKKDITEIAAMMLPRALDELTRMRGGGDDPPESGEPENSQEFTINYDAFQKFLADPANREENLDYYVAFVDGEFKGRERDRASLLAWLLSTFPNRPKFYALVQQREDVEDIPGPFSVEDF
jgi:CheY-like chemotaxis protein